MHTTVGRVVTGVAAVAIAAQGLATCSMPARPTGDDLDGATKPLTGETSNLAVDGSLQLAQNTNVPTGITLEDDPAPTTRSEQSLFSGPTLTKNDGLWIREKDEFASMVMQIRESGDGRMSATLLWPGAGAMQYGWRAGDKKLKDIFRVKDDSSEQYEVASMKKGEQGAYFEGGTLTVLDDGRLLYKSDAATGGIGDKQVWRPLDQSSAEMAYVWYGQAAAAADREEYAAVNKLVNKIAQSGISDAGFLNSVAWILATTSVKDIRNPGLAVTLSQRSNQLLKDLSYIDTLAAAFAANGQFEKAVELQGLVNKNLPPIELMADAGRAMAGLVTFEGRLKLYKESKPYIDETAGF